MTFEWMGLATVLAGILCLIKGRRVAIFVFVFSTLFGASAATVLTALGSANLLPSHLLLGFLLPIAAQRAHLGRFLEAFVWPRAGAWLLITLAYTVIGVIFMPRLFAGLTDVFAVTRSETGAAGLMLTPLQPVSGNLTQMVYFIGNVACFGMLYAFARDRDGKRWLADALLLCGCGNIVFAVLDYVTFFTQTADYLGFMRNATYRIFDTAEVVGIKRLIGSFPEASAFASASLVLFAFALTLCLNGYRSVISGTLAVLLLVALILSTSATAYVSLAAFLALTYAACAIRLLSGGGDRGRLRFLVGCPLLAVIVVVLVRLDAGLSSAIGDLLDQLIFQKSGTDSGIERGNWNMHAMQNFLDSHGLGVGIGSVRASSFIIAALANIGLFGTATFLIFALACLWAPTGDPDRLSRSVREAAAAACLALLISGTAAGTTVDLGLLFFICAGIAAAPTLGSRQPVARRPAIVSSNGVTGPVAAQGGWARPVG